MLHDFDQLWQNEKYFGTHKYLSVFCGSAPVVDHGSHNGPANAQLYPVETVLKYSCYPGNLQNMAFIYLFEMNSFLPRLPDRGFCSL